MNEKGILRSFNLPHDDLQDLWDRIIVPQGLKDSLLSQLVLEFVVRGKVSNTALPLHGIILLVGPPGTGKTSLAKAAASQTATMLGRTVQYLEAEPHSLTSSAHGKTQREVQNFFQSTIHERAANGPLIVLLDEVETLAADRSKMSLDANPIDVHRATDAVLASLDELAGKYPHLVFIATSNFEKAIDEAFLSRADRIFRVEKPDAAACRAILIDTIEILAGSYPAMSELARSSTFDEIAKLAVGLDGRQLRKSLLHACTFDKETALNPNRVRAEDLRRALTELRGGAL